MSSLLNLQQQRRSIYQLGRNVSATPEALNQLIFNTIREAPAAFNSQSSRAIVLYGDANQALWLDLTAAILKPLTPPANFAGTQAKLAGFAAGIGTILFFEDQAVVKELQAHYSLYAESFPAFSEEASGMAQYATWLALSEQGLGANLQHYNPVIDKAVADKWPVPASWKLRSQMPFGSIEAPAAAKDYRSDENRFLTFTK